MATPAQISANTNNASASTGPRTAEGKLASSQNAATHGLSGSFHVLPHEDKSDFDNRLASYIEEFSPRSAHQSFLVNQMVHSSWLMDRNRRLQVHVVALMSGADPAGNPESIIADALIEKTTDALFVLQRYIA